MSEQSNFYSRRSKLRRFFEVEMRKSNALLKKRCIEKYNEYIFVRFSGHMIERLIDRGIDEKYIMEVFRKMSDKTSELMEFLHMKDRPIRLEVTDGNLWIGMTVDLIEEGKGYNGLCCRMIIENPKRLAGKIPTYVINVN